MDMPVIQGNSIEYVTKEASRGNYAEVRLAVQYNPWLAHQEVNGKNLVNAAARGCHCLVSGNEHAEIIRFLLSKNAKSILVDQNGESPIHHAAQYGENDILEQLLQHDSSRVNGINNDGWTAVHCAALCRWESRQKMCVESIKLLRTYGAEINKKDKQGRTPLIIATQRANVDIIEYLLACNARGNIADSKGNYPIHYVMHAKTESVFYIFHLLLTHGSFTLLDVANKQEHTPLQELHETERKYAQQSDKDGLWRCSQIRMIVHGFREKRILCSS